MHTDFNTELHGSIWGYDTSSIVANVNAVAEFELIKTI
jgi:hypothetical protein